MHEDIVEHISKDKGYNEGFETGFEAGKKRAWYLIGEFAEYYKKQLNPDSLAPPHQSDLERGRYEAALYAQMVIKKNKL